MKSLAFILLSLYLCSCAQIIPLQNQSSDPQEMLLSGIGSLSQDGSTIELDRLIEKHHKTRQAVAARQILELLEKMDKINDQLSTSNKKLSQENNLLKNDLEKLRQLLIKSEKRAS